MAVCMVVSSMLPLGVAVAQSGSPGDLSTSDALEPWGGKTTPYTASLFDGGFTVTDRVITHGSGIPGWYVKYDASDADAFNELEAWVDRSRDRTILWHDAETGLTLVSAPAKAVRRPGGVFGFSRDGLSTLGFVEWVEIEQRVERVEPVTLKDESAVQAENPVPRTLDLLAKLDGGDFGTEEGTTQGVAYGDGVNRTSMKQVRDTIGASPSELPASADGSGATIAVLDTGANTADGVIFGNGTQGSNIRIEYGKNFITNESINTTSGNYSAISDGNGHGTYVAARAAGAAGGNTSTRAPAYNSTLAIGKVLGDDGSGSIHQIVKGVRWASESPVDADVISMSLGSMRYSKALEDSIHHALEDEGVTAITVAAGNSRWTWGRANLGSPADADGVIAVAATTTGNTSTLETAYFSNTGEDGGVVDGSNRHTRGENPDVGSPGMANTVMVATSNGGTANVTLSGTSMSTPDVASAIAVLLDENPSLIGRHEAVRTRVLETASPAPQIGVTEIGHGVLNVSNLLTDTRPQLDQEDARTAQAKSRDQANLAMKGRIATYLRSRGVTV